MTTVTLEINERTKAGSTLMSLLDVLSGKSGVKIVEEKNKSPYNPEFVKKIKQAQKRGAYRTINPDNIWEGM